MRPVPIPARVSRTRGWITQGGFLADLEVRTCQAGSAILLGAGCGLAAMRVLPEIEPMATLDLRMADLRVVGSVSPLCVRADRRLWGWCCLFGTVWPSIGIDTIGANRAGIGMIQTSSTI